MAVWGFPIFEIHLICARGWESNDDDLVTIYLQSRDGLQRGFPRQLSDTGGPMFMIRVTIHLVHDGYSRLWVVV